MPEKDDNIVLLELGNKVRTQRKKKKLSQRELAALADLTPSQVANIEQGKTNIKFVSLMKLLWALECEPNDLVPKS